MYFLFFDTNHYQAFKHLTCRLLRSKGPSIIDIDQLADSQIQITVFWRNFMNFQIRCIVNSLKNCILHPKKCTDKRDVHVVLFSLLADQLSSQFLIFYGWPKENCPISETEQFFLSTLLIFLSSLDIREWPIFKKDWPKKYPVSEGASIWLWSITLGNQ